MKPLTLAIIVAFVFGGLRAAPRLAAISGTRASADLAAHRT
jgi:hypothetical protein